MNDCAIDDENPQDDESPQGQNLENYEDLMFEQDKNMSYEEAASYAESVKNDSSKILVKTFFIDRESGFVVLPDIYKRTVDFNNKKIYYKKIDSWNIYFENEEFVWGNGLVISSNNYYSNEFDTTIILRIQNSGEEYNKFSLTVRIIKEYKKVESVHLRLSDETTEIKIDETKSLFAVAYPVGPYPAGASYQETEYKIRKIVLPDGLELTEDFEEYAYLFNHKISTTTDIPIGSKIYISAVATHDNVESNILCLDVVRTTVEDFKL